ncbi:hypothetical protein HYQ45_017628 [Verticillium longisporum]|uniref:Uncharacterized protein n=1 Tax=Verticillium longisporum TaxID=100787 RepID=A0A8I3AFD4_VERLO|nr:hypothetical protein HYQ45_017628 [Verticillium longisporum]
MQPPLRLQRGLELLRSRLDILNLSFENQDAVLDVPNLAPKRIDLVIEPRGENLNLPDGLGEAPALGSNEFGRALLDALVGFRELIVEALDLLVLARIVRVKGFNGLNLCDDPG